MDHLHFKHIYNILIHNNNHLVVPLEFRLFQILENNKMLALRNVRTFTKLRLYTSK